MCQEGVHSILVAIQLTSLTQVYCSFIYIFFLLFFFFIMNFMAVLQLSHLNIVIALWLLGVIEDILKMSSQTLA